MNISSKKYIYTVDVIFSNRVSEMAGVWEDPAFATAIGAAGVDIAALHENVDTDDLSKTLEQTMLGTQTGKCFKTKIFCCH